MMTVKMKSHQQKKLNNLLIRKIQNQSRKAKLIYKIKQKTPLQLDLAKTMIRPSAKKWIRRRKTTSQIHIPMMIR